MEQDWKRNLQLTPRSIIVCPASAREDMEGATQVAPAVTEIPHVPGTTETFKNKEEIINKICQIKVIPMSTRRLTQGKQKAPGMSVYTPACQACLHALP